MNLRILSALFLLMLILSAQASASVKEKVAAPFNAVASYVNKLAVGTNETLTGAVGGLNNAASGLAKDTNDFGKDIYRSAGGSVE